MPTEIEEAEQIVATQDHYFSVSQNELEALIKESPFGESVNCTLGPRVRLIWRKGEKIPWAVNKLAEMRGVLGSNHCGGGI